jgi:hypothetical protein
MDKLSRAKGIGNDAESLWWGFKRRIHAVSRGGDDRNDVE